ncbi:T9SS type A sorting domain-containing protein [Pontibacter sp. Tf4]|uniref:T9SS type A sorting domain-containing protein n=1 Tax=Pontibacter sp. Tf4 TaxID=2761620 RepID=UPI00162431D1|nr:T9SS type A sorting domain-containing protein [Pontibacter sp. Tf4]MBB6611286.1 T9SS type A sorting domain-containing protein [Pontibacter sp. Tf4]
MKDILIHTHRTGNFLSKQLHALWQIAMVMTAVFSFSVNTNAQNLPPATSCTSNDLRVLSASLSGTGCVTCTPGEPLTSNLTFRIENTTESNRTAYAYWGTLVIKDANGNVISSTPISDCNDDGFPGGTTQTLISIPITYNCGNQVEIQNFYGAWTPASDIAANQCPAITANPDKIAPKCDAIPVLPIRTPVVAFAGDDFSITCVSNPNGKQIGESPQTGFTYSWTPTTGLSASNISNPTANPTTTTTYTVTKTRTADNCSDTDQITVTVDNAAVTAFAGDDFTITCTSNTNGKQIGEAPDAAFTYSWEPADGLSATNISNPIANPTEPKTYTVTKTDISSGCTDTDVIEVDVDITPSGVVGVLDEERCGPGIVTFEVPTPLNGVTYRWYDAATNGNLLETGTTFTTSSLSSTTSFWITATSANGCVTTPEEVQALIFTPVVTNAGTDVTSCSADPVQLNGSVTGGATTGSWTGGTGTFNPSRNVLNPTYTPSAAEVSAGTVTLTLTSADPTGPCPTDDDAVTITISNMVLSAIVTDVACNGASTGAINLSVSGGVSPYTYDWSNDGAESPDNDPQDLTGLAAGSYTVTVTDANGCTATLTEVVDEASDITLSAVVTHVACNGGSTGAINLSVSGGVSPYTFDWSNDGAESPDNDTEDLSGLAAGTYTVTVTDANGCTETLTRTVEEASGIMLSAIVTDVACNGASTGAINLSVSGGTSPYTYDWSNDGLENPDNDAQDLTNLAAGSYTVIVTDANGCTATLTETVDQASDIVLSAVVTDVACNGASTGAINLSVSGGVSPYTYDWSNDGAESPDNDPQDLTGLAAGTYTVTVTDANGCTETLTETVDQPTGITVTATGSNPTCANLSGGSISGTISGGTGPYTVSVNNFASSVNSTGSYTIPNLGAGSYTVSVRDANQCTASSSVVTLVAPTCVAFEGCTLGYWKNHTNRWVTCDGLNLSPNTKYGTVFADAPASLKDLTLIQVLNLGGGGINNLGRQSVAAILNACHPDVDYKLTTSQIISGVNAAFRNNTAGSYATYLDGLNNAGCPLGGTPATPKSITKVQKLDGVESDRISAYPTPFSDKATIEFTTSRTENFVVNLYDMKGALVRQLKAGTAKAGELQVVEVDGAGLNEGLYIARMTSDSGAKAVKLLLKRD